MSSTQPASTSSTFESSSSSSSSNNRNIDNNEILPELSRSYKYRHYFYGSLSSVEESSSSSSATTASKQIINQRKRRKVNDLSPHSSSSSSCSCFEVRRCNEKGGGIGMFATKKIECGDLIISNEDSIVNVISSTKNQYSNNKICDGCSTPLGTLRDQLGAPSHLTLPYLEANCDGIIYTSNDNHHFVCKDCQLISWCSKECQDRNQLQHSFICTRDVIGNEDGDTSSLKQYHKQRKDLLDFYSSIQDYTSPLIFQLAVNVITLILSKVVAAIRLQQQSSRQQSQQQVVFEERQMYWWRDYGSHPIWWQILSQTEDEGDEEKGSVVNEMNHHHQESRKSQATRFANILRCLLNESIRINFATNKNGNRNDDNCTQRDNNTNAISILQSLTIWADRLCSLQPIGEILGMLQCNVMEFEHPSPVQQYMEFINADDDHDDHDENNFDQQDTGDGSHEMYKMEEETHHTNENSLSNQQIVSSDSCEENVRYNENEKIALEWLTRHVIIPKEDDEEENEKHNDCGESEGPTYSKAIEGGSHERVIAAPIVGSGLYPLLTLANHDCNPNASIDFLHETNRGSMVAIRNIAIGEEITITYVPNGGGCSGNDDLQTTPIEDDNDTSAVTAGFSPSSDKRFQHFEPTRTWKWLHQFDDADGGDEEGNEDGISGDNASDDNRVEKDRDASIRDAAGMNGGSCHASSAECEKDIPEKQQEQLTPLEGADYRERQAALLAYNFRCQCLRCIQEMNKDPPAGHGHDGE